MLIASFRFTRLCCLALVLELTTSVAFRAAAIATSQDAASLSGPEKSEPRDPATITLLAMDLSAARNMLRQHDLDDDGALNKTEMERTRWNPEDVKRFDINRDGEMHPLEIALKLADARMDDGIVQMDATLADRYMNQYDANRDQRLSMEELSRNTFTDQAASYDKNSDDELTHTELIRGLAFERRIRDELGIKGCDQGGAMKLINRGDRDKDRRIGADELEQAGLSRAAMDFDRNDDDRLSVSELAECLASRRYAMGLTPSDQLAARSILTRMDRDGNGTIAAAEIASGSNQEFLIQFDRDNDGDVTETELERHFGDRRKELGYEDEDLTRASTLIQRNDADRSRTLSRAELSASGADRSSPLSPTNLSIIDEDNDGAVSVDELARYLNKTR